MHFNIVHLMYCIMFFLKVFSAQHFQCSIIKNLLKLFKFLYDVVLGTSKLRVNKAIKRF